MFFQLFGAKNKQHRCTNTDLTNANAETTMMNLLWLTRGTGSAAAQIRGREDETLS